MDLRHLECFLAVAQEKSFTRAAQRLHLVQSGVSATIRSLENELGAALFERTSRRVALTAAGHALLPEAHAALAAVQAARDAVGETSEGLRGDLSVGTMTTVGGLDLPRLIGRFHAAHPKVTVRLRAATTGSAGLAQELLAGTLDLAFLSLPGTAPPGLSVRHLSSAPFVAVLPRRHPLGDRPAVRLTDLLRETFIESPAGFGNRAVTDMAFQALGLHRTVRIEVSDISTATAYVRNGLGVALMPDFAVDPRDGALSVCPVAGTDLRWSLDVAVSASRRPAAAVRALLDMVDDHIRLSPDVPAAPPAVDGGGATTAPTG